MSAFTTCVVTHTFQNPDGSSATGTVTFQLTKRMTNSGTTVLQSEIVANLDAGGALSQSLVANNDPGTTPTDAAWTVTFRMPPASEITYQIVVPTGGGTIDLGTLLPQQPNAG